MKDKYINFNDLKSKESRKNYSVEYNDSNKKYDVLIFTPHGGGIEPGTSEIVREVSRNNFNHYCFNGEGQGCKRMHITSHRYNEPKLRDEIKRYKECVSIHGMENRKDCEIYLGGLNDLQIKRATVILKRAGYKVLSRLKKYIRRLAATEVTNVTNRCKSGKGMQIEISDSLRKKLFTGDYKKKRGRRAKTEEFNKLCTALKDCCNPITR